MKMTGDTSLVENKDKELSFLGSWNLTNGDTALIISKTKQVIKATGKSHVVWVGVVITQETIILPVDVLGIPIQSNKMGCKFVPGIWDAQGNFLDRTNNNQWDIVSQIREKAY